MVQLRTGDGAPVAPARVHDDGAEAARAEVGERGAHVGLVRAAREAVRDEHYRLRARGGIGGVGSGGGGGGGGGGERGLGGEGGRDVEREGA